VIACVHSANKMNLTMKLNLIGQLFGIVVRVNSDPNLQ
jgi:hypothetical protein